MGLSDVQKLVSLRARETERTFAESEADHNAMLKMEGCLKGVVEGMRARLRAMQDEAEKAGKGA